MDDEWARVWKVKGATKKCVSVVSEIVVVQTRKRFLAGMEKLYTISLLE